MDPTINPPKKTQKYECTVCLYETCDKKDFRKHCATAKHIRRTTSDFSDEISDNSTSISNNFVCKCGKQYKHMTSLYNHKKKCNANNTPTNVSDSQNPDLNSPNQQDNLVFSYNFVMELVKQNQEFQKIMLEQIVEQNKQIIELSNKNQIVNNNCTTTNAKFNLQFFLNETCKDAMNIGEFVESVKLQISDLETIGTKGFVNGISNVIIQNLKDLDITKRPLHCTDSKREVLYVKDDNKWEKESDERIKMKKVINQISNKNIQQISEWVEQNPGCKNSDSSKNDDYLHIVSESMGCCEPANYGKIIHNISKKVIVDK